jgi:hypothetical protein
MLSQALVPTTPTVNPTFAVYKNSAIESTTGITVTVDYDGKAGLIFVAIDTSADPTFYIAGEDYDVVFTAGTVDGKDLTRVPVRMFSMENRSRKANVVQIAGQTANAAAAVTFPASVANETTVAARASQTSVDGKPTLAQIEASTVLAKEATVAARASQTSVDGKPTLAQIEASTVLAKEVTVAARASQTSVDGKPTLAQIEASTVLAKEVTVAARASQTSVDGKPTLAQIEASTVLAKEATVAQLDAGVELIKDDTTALINAVASVLARIGSFTGTGVNTILGFMRALLRKDGSITTPSDVGGTYSHATDSLEAIRDRGDAAWTTGAGGGGGGGDPWATDLPAGSYTANQAGSIVQAIAAKTNTINAGKVSYAGPVTAKGRIDQVIIGDDYLTAHGTAFVWTIDAIAGMSAAAVTVSFGGKCGTNIFARTGTATDIGSGKWSLVVEMPRANSGNLIAGEYLYSVEVRNAAGVELTRIYYDEPFVAVEKFT